MGNVLALGNSIVFPAPPPSYTSQLYELIWIPKRFAYDKSGSQNSTHGSFPVLYLQSPTPTKVMVIYLHANSCDIGQVKPELRLISHELGVSVMAVEYPGYGISPEIPVATGDLIDCRVRATVNFLLSLGVDSRNIVFFGRSIGTGPAAAMAAEFKQAGVQCGGVVLQAPYISLHKIVEEYFSVGTWVVPNYWDTLLSLKHMGPETPLLVIHGLADEIIPVYHGQTLYESYQSENKMADFQTTSKHNSYSILDDLCIPISKFLKTLSLTREAPLVEIKLPQWCLYSCHKLVNGQTVLERNRKTSARNIVDKQVCSARLPERKEMPKIARHNSMTHDPKFSETDSQLQQSFVAAAAISEGVDQFGGLEHTEKAVNRSISKVSFQSSLHDLCEQNALNDDDISDFVNEAKARTSRQP